jgi:hypothetical protein
MRFDLTRLFSAYVMVGIGWSGTVQAAQSVPPDLLTLPWVQIGLGTVIAFWGGLTRTAERAASASKRGEDFPLLIEAIQDLTASTGAGFLFFMVGSWARLDVWALGAGLFVAGYFGTKFVARYAGSWLQRTVDQHSRRGELDDKS